MHKDTPKRAFAARDAHDALLDLKHLLDEAAVAAHAAELQAFHLAVGFPRGGLPSFRHGAASALLADGASPAVVQRQLRHSDPRITLGIYAHVVGDQQRNAVQNRSARLVH